MKKYILLTVLLLVSLSSFALGQKQTYLYAVKGADSLYLDHYVSSKEAMRPCMIFVFGGGFVRGERDNKGYLPYFEYLNDSIPEIHQHRLQDPLLRNYKQPSSDYTLVS